MDLLDVLEKQINTFGIGVDVRIGVLGDKDSISILQLPSNFETHYMDGTIEKVYNIQIDSKFKRQRDSYNNLNKIINELHLVGLDSLDESYLYEGFNVTTGTHLTTYDVEGYYIHSATIGVNVLL